MWSYLGCVFCAQMRSFVNDIELVNSVFQFRNRSFINWYEWSFILVDQIDSAVGKYILSRRRIWSSYSNREFVWKQESTFLPMKLYRVAGDHLEPVCSCCNIEIHDHVHRSLRQHKRMTLKRQNSKLAIDCSTRDTSNGLIYKQAKLIFNEESKLINYFKSLPLSCALRLYTVTRWCSPRHRSRQQLHAKVWGFGNKKNRPDQMSTTFNYFNGDVIKKMKFSYSTRYKYIYIYIHYHYRSNRLHSSRWTRDQEFARNQYLSFDWVR